MPSSLKACQTMYEVSLQSKCKTIIDVGSGFGFLAIYFAFKYKDKKVIGYETSLFPWIVSMMLKKICRCDNLSFYRKNYLTIDLPNDCLFICYLFPAGMLLLEEKLKDSTTIVISNTFSFKTKKTKQIIKVNDLYKTPIYVY